MSKKADKSETTKSERLLMANGMVKDAIADEEHFICIMSSDDGENCKSSVVGYGRTKVFAHCLVEVIKADEKLKDLVLAELALMCLTDLEGQREAHKEAK